MPPYIDGLEEEVLSRLDVAHHALLLSPSAQVSTPDPRPSRP